MNPALAAAHALVVLALAYWLWSAYAVARTARAVPRLADLAPREPARWPRVSLVVPACNEAQDLEAAVASRLADDYPDLELVLVDDRSTDGTGAIADAIAARDPRVRVIHVEHLPAGWLGKLHAMARGVERATGEFLLFSDADVHVAKGTLRRAVARCEEGGFDHLTLLPDFWSSGFWLDVVLSAFGRMACVGGRLWAVEDPRSSAVVGAGLFNLVRRAAYDRTPGFEHLRLEVVDDMALAQMLKDHGARTTVVNGQGMVGLYFYRSLGEMFRGSEKNGFAVVGRFSVARLVASAALYVALEAGPFLALALPLAPWARVAAAAACAVALASGLYANAWMRRPLAPALLAPVGAALLAAMFLRSGYLAVRRGGVEWRGTLYRTADLRAGRRMRIP